MFKREAQKTADSVMPRYKICVSGAAETDFFHEKSLQGAKAVGAEIARHGLIMITGATTGLPYWAAKAAKEAGGFVIGISPAATKREHVEVYKLPLDYHDLIVFTGFGYSGRNLFLTRSADAVVTLGGRIGTLNEFTDSFEDGKPQGVLMGSGGTTDLLPQILDAAHRGRGKAVFDADPKRLIDKVVAMIEEENKELGI